MLPEFKRKNETVSKMKTLPIKKRTDIFIPSYVYPPNDMSLLHSHGTHNP